MNKKHFNQLVKNYTDLESSHHELVKLVDQYPYSHPVRMLCVKSSTGLPKSDFQKQLALAAFYTTDRNVLRALVEKGKVPGDIKATSEAVKVPSQPKKKVKSPPAGNADTTNRLKVDSENLRKEVLHNLEEMLKSKNEFLRLIEEEPILKSPKSAKTAQTDNKDKTKSAKVAKKKVTPKAAKPAKSTEQAKKPVSKSRNELIDEFIAAEPTISPGKESSSKQSDLSRPSSELKEDLVSENLALIFANQGKTAKAIDIYKKLIWKFPQKKASFAARIEELKKK